MDERLKELLEKLEYELDGGHNEMDTCVDLIDWFHKYKKDIENGEHT